MKLHLVDMTIVIIYLVGMAAIGFIMERRARRGVGSYFLAGNELPWWMLGISNAASMFNIAGTMWLVYLLFVYGLKSVFIPWLWPVFNQIFLMVYLSAWLRRSGAVTGAEWITMRFGHDLGAEASRISVAVYALVSVIAFSGYGYVGIREFAEIFLPREVSPNTYALAIVGITTLYTVAGGLYGVVLTDLIQFVIMVASSLALGLIAMYLVSPELLSERLPHGWSDIWFGWQLDLDWSPLVPAAQEQIERDGYTLFGAFFGMMVFKGILVSAAGPAPNYDMQRILAAKDAREASMMSGLVSVALFVPRFFMIAGIVVMAVALVDHEPGALSATYFEQLLPVVIHQYVPVGLKGLLIAGFLASFMSTFASAINAAAAYVVNDVYKRYVRPDGTQREYIRAGYAISTLIVVAGCTAGLFISSVSTATNWIVSALWVGYAVPNVLKWHWWRLNGYGYLSGMLVGISGALLTVFIPEIRYWMAYPSIALLSLWMNTTELTVDLSLFAFPTLALASLVGTMLGSLIAAPVKESVVLDFYCRTRPWGLWSPIARAAVARDPGFEPNRTFWRDALNVLVGIVGQTCFVAIPIYIVLREWTAAMTCLAILVVTSSILKRTWYDHLQLE